ncbi:MAG: DNA/RNA non-specific endonuclease [Bacteroidales bacterium]|nr:DNA/RNA non-specific endonuclease [Bacteroidales bacterium]
MLLIRLLLNRVCCILVAGFTLCLTISCYKPSGSSYQDIEKVSRESLQVYSPYDLIRHYAGFTTQYNPTTLQPDWVMYTLTAQQVEMTRHTPKVERNFQPDPELALPQASNEDYHNSGWVRGHMARRQDMKWSVQAVVESDYFTNICPQNKEMNNGVWHRIENHARILAKRYGSVDIVCGPLFYDGNDSVIGPNHVRVPDAFFKAFLVLKNDVYYSVAFLCPNDSCNRQMTDVAVCINKIEDISGHDLFPLLPDDEEELVEGRVDSLLLRKK